MREQNSGREQIRAVNKIGAATTGSERVNKILPGEQNRSKYEQNRAVNKIVSVNKIGAVQHFLMASVLTQE